MNIEKLKKEYGEQDCSGTAYPIYCSVQEQICIGVINEYYSVICPYGDGEMLIETNDEGETIYMGYIWHPVEFFLTVRGAKEYIENNRHNFTGATRVYIHHFDRRNIEMRGLLEELNFKKSK